MGLYESWITEIIFSTLLLSDIVDTVGFGTVQFGS